MYQKFLAELGQKELTKEFGDNWLSDAINKKFCEEEDALIGFCLKEGIFVLATEENKKLAEEAAAKALENEASGNS